MTPRVDQQVFWLQVSEAYALVVQMGQANEGFHNVERRLQLVELRLGLLGLKLKQCAIWDQVEDKEHRIVVLQGPMKVNYEGRLERFQNVALPTDLLHLVGLVPDRG